MDSVKAMFLTHLHPDHAKGVGPFIWASLEMEMMGYDTSSKY